MEQITLENLQNQVIALQEQMNALQKFVQEDLEFARRTEEAWQEIEEGKCKTMSKEDFLEELEKW